MKYILNAFGECRRLYRGVGRRRCAARAADWLFGGDADGASSEIVRMDQIRLNELQPSDDHETAGAARDRGREGAESVSGNQEAWGETWGHWKPQEVSEASVAGLSVVVAGKLGGARGQEGEGGEGAEGVSRHHLTPWGFSHGAFFQAHVKCGRRRKRPACRRRSWPASTLGVCSSGTPSWMCLGLRCGDERQCQAKKTSGKSGAQKDGWKIDVYEICRVQRGIPPSGQHLESRNDLNVLTTRFSYLT